MQGIALDRLKVLLDAWRQHDWPGLEERWNEIPHYRTHLDGLNIAFWHLRLPEPTAIPLVLTRPYPFRVQRPAPRRGWNPGCAARALAELMSVLGYERFRAHGGRTVPHFVPKQSRLVDASCPGPSGERRL